MDKKKKIEFEKKFDDAVKECAMMFPLVKESEGKTIWKPLENILPKEWLDGFMFMGKYNYLIEHPHNQLANREINDYKHGITRKYLHIGNDGKCFENTGYKKDKIILRECSCKNAIENVFKDIEKFGATRETIYDEKYRNEICKKLADLGFTVFGISPMKVKKTRKEYQFEEEF